MAGILYGWIGIYYGQFAYMFDTWGYHHVSVDEYKLLFHNPSEYFTNIFQSGYENKFGGFFDSSESWWNDLKGNLFIKVLSLFNIFSFGNYYVNVIFYSFFTLFGPIAFFRVMNDVFPGKKMQIIFSAFLIPSFLYWTSGIHKDGLVFMAISLIIYNFYFALKEENFSRKRIIIIAISLLIVLAFRNFIFALLLPALIAWYYSYQKSKRGILTYVVVYSFFSLIFFSAKYISPILDFPQAVVNKQEAFKILQGNSGIEMPELKPTALSFLYNSPKALESTILRPYPGDVKHLLSLAAATETIILLLFFLCFLIWRKNGVHSKQFILFCIFFSFSFLLSIGYSVSFLGAIVRYRSIIIPFLITPVICLTDWNKLGKIFFNNINNNANI